MTADAAVRRRRWAIAIASVLAAGWLVAAIDRRAQPEVAEATPRSAAPRTGVARTVAPAEVVVRDLVPREQLVAPRGTAAAVVDLFAAPPRVPTALPARSVVSAASAVPPAPASPAFTYLGRRRDDRGWQVFLGSGDTAYVVREGDVVAGDYRVASIRPPVLTLAHGERTLRIAIGDWE